MDLKFAKFLALLVPKICENFLNLAKPNKLFIIRFLFLIQSLPLRQFPDEQQQGEYYAVAAYGKLQEYLA